jgi:hypothetical protein
MLMMSNDDNITPIQAIASGGGEGASASDTVLTPTDSEKPVPPPVPLTKEEIGQSYDQFLLGGVELFVRYTEEIKRLRAENYRMIKHLIEFQDRANEMKSEFDLMSYHFSNLPSLEKRISDIHKENRLKSKQIFKPKPEKIWVPGQR